MSLFWLRFALLFYGFGLIYALAMLLRHQKSISRAVTGLVALGGVLHFVSLVEAFAPTRRFIPQTLHEYESLLALLILLMLWAIFLRWKTLMPGVVVFPLVFLLTMMAAIGPDPVRIQAGLLKNSWIAMHVLLVFAGLAVLVFSFVSSILYLVQERNLKAKRSTGLLANLPPLQVLDDIGYKSLLIGFPIMTIGLIAGSVLAQEYFGASYFRDPKVLFSMLMWGVYMVMLYTRWSAGWRGRKAAFLSTFAFVAALLAWVANSLGGMNRMIP